MEFILVAAPPSLLPLLLLLLRAIFLLPLPAGVRRWPAVPRYFYALESMHYARQSALKY